MSGTTTDMSHDVRRAELRDVPAIVELIYGLADYEKLLHECTVTAEQMETALFGSSPSVFAHVAEAKGEVVGIAVWFKSFSTWDGVSGIYLEDLYVRPEDRGNGHGLRLLRALATECIDQGFTRLGWSVLTWNEPSIQFYKALGAVAQDEWTGYRLSGESLKVLAAGA